MKKMKMVLFIFALFLLVGCNKEVTNKQVTSNTINDTTNDVEENLVESVEEEICSGELEYIENISLNSAFEFDEEKVAMAVDMGFPSPATELEVYKYGLQDSDVIQYDLKKDSFELRDSLTHSGFDGIEVIYEKTQYNWNDFFDDLDVSEFKHSITVSLQGNSIYEEDIEDEYQKYFRYYDENKGLYYEVQDFMTGNFLEEDAELTNVRMGNVINYIALGDMGAPTYNPLIIQNEEEVLSYYITALNEKPCLYMEYIYNNQLYKEWISISNGITIKELVFAENGLLQSQKIAISITEKDMDQSVFQEPTDVEFQDITLFVYSFLGGDLEPLAKAIMKLIPENETGILLTSEQGEIETIYTTGLYEMSIEDPLYWEQNILDSGDTRTLRYIKADRFYTICEELEIVEIYDQSCYEKKFFNFEEVGLLGVEITESEKIYSFYNPNNISVSGLYDVYEYVIESDTLLHINFYQIENIFDTEIKRNVISYSASLIPYEESVYDESCMDTYEIIDYGEGSFNDGEYMPFWYK